MPLPVPGEPAPAPETLFGGHPLSYGAKMGVHDPCETRQREDLIAASTHEIRERFRGAAPPPGYFGYGSHCGEQVVEDAEFPTAAANSRWQDQLSARMNTNDTHSRALQIPPPNVANGIFLHTQLAD